ncbi:hypothetical protein [Maribellus mangrovi]|uniref:hypothetical protein n=1 Tax=Maribellus mangrovi TaxID=3133146 RepID=UPI0030EC3B8A
MRELKKQLEVLLINHFRDSYAEFPRGRIVLAESPDFVVKVPSKRRLGIELTRLSPETSVDAFESHINEIQLRIIELAKELFERNNPHKLFVKFRFSGEYPISEVSELSLAARLSAIIRHAVQSKNPRSNFSLTIHAKLPHEIEQLLLVHHPNLKTNVWEVANNLGLSDNVIHDIQTAIDKKEEKLELYRRKKCDEYWLLITADYLRGTRNYHVQNQLQNHNFQSGFDRVFLMELINERVFELSV